MTGALLEQEINFQSEEHARPSNEEWATPSLVFKLGWDMLNCCRFYNVCIGGVKLDGNYTFYALIRGLLFQDRYPLRVHLWRFKWILVKLKTNIQISLRWGERSRALLSLVRQWLLGISAPAWSQAIQPLQQMQTLISPAPQRQSNGLE